MNLFLRLLWLLLTGRLRPRVALLAPCETVFRVWPSGLDVLGHVNNGVYLSLCDLARVDLMVRGGLWAKLKAGGLYPVIAAETISFRRSLRLGQGFRVETRVLGWDERVFFLEHRFRRGQNPELVATAVVAARFLRRGGGGVTAAVILGLAGLGAEPSPTLPGWVERWYADGRASAAHA